MGELTQLKYSDRLRQAWRARNKRTDFNVKPVITCALLFAFVYILFAMLVHPADRTLDYHFYSERGLVTALSATLLAMSGAFALGTLIVHQKNSIGGLWPWAIMALGFLFLALDETAQFHERTGDLLHDVADSGIFRNWNDVIVIIYGVVAVPFIVVLMPAILKYRMTFELFIFAFLCYVIHTLIDSTQEPSTVTSIILEESAKLYCGVLLALSMLLSFMGALWSEGPDSRGE